MYCEWGGLGSGKICNAEVINYYYVPKMDVLSKSDFIMAVCSYHKQVLKDEFRIKLSSKNEWKTAKVLEA